MLTLATEFFDVPHTWDFTLRYQDQVEVISHYAGLVKHGLTQFDMVMQFFKSWYGICEITATCDGSEISLEDIYNGNWRLQK